jgi:hypothetical protein
MTSEKNATLLEKILKRTKEGTINWEATHSDETFQASFPNYSIRINRRHYEPEYPGDDGISYELDIYNKDGKLIEEIYPVGLREAINNPFQVFQEIFLLARRMAFGVEEALDELISVLGEGEGKTQF